MKKLLYIIGIFATLSTLLLSGCDDEDTYADMKEKEKSAISRFIKDNEYCGPIKVISEEEFYANDSITDTARNEFVLFQEDGIYMQIVSKGEGKTMIEMAKEQSTDSTISKGILCKFMEYDIKNDYVCASNVNLTSIVDKMTCKYTHRSRSYTASFTEGQMMSTYGSTVPTGWLKPLDYIRLTRAEGRKARIRLIIPHSSGTLTASGSVLPMYYEISYQLGI
ncbi:MAG: DUF4827 domain-containing protein [Bacteroidaceae bacterium]|nr:DUF4827 domain-containing protein [Bacteroidaceae bacterium]